MLTTELREGTRTTESYVDDREVCHDTIRSSDDRARILEDVERAMKDLDYAEEDVFGMHLSLAEAMDNAIKHGHRGDWSRPVQVRYFTEEDYVVVQVEDQGPGFDPTEVPDPRKEENLGRSSGRGVLLMQTYMTWLKYNPRGNCITL